MVSGKCKLTLENVKHFYKVCEKFTFFKTFLHLTKQNYITRTFLPVLKQICFSENKLTRQVKVVKQIYKWHILEFPTTVLDIWSQVTPVTLKTGVGVPGRSTNTLITAEEVPWMMEKHPSCPRFNLGWPSLDDLVKATQVL